VDIPDQFFEIRIFLTQNGFVAILKKLAVTLVFAVEPACVARKKAAHENGNGSSAGSQQQVNMIIEHCPGKTINTRRRNQGRQSFYKIVPIKIGTEYFSPFDSPVSPPVKNGPAFRRKSDPPSRKRVMIPPDGLD
jgi:hypothetical protein